MSRFSGKKEKDTPAISTASLPDIIFILLFFFMVVTVMREQEQKVRTLLPQATELTKLEKKSLVSTIAIGQPTLKYKAQLGTAPRIQLNDAFATKEDVGPWVEQERASTPEGSRNAMTFALKVDKEAKMGLISDVKQELRKANALKVNYSALPRADKE